MCIIGCSPKRAGEEFFNELKDSPLNIKELAKKHRVGIKVIELPIKSIIKNGKLDEKIFSNWVKGLVRNINIGNNKFGYQRAFLVAQGRTIENRNLFLPIFRRISGSLSDLIKVNLRLSLRIIPKKRYNKNFSKPKIIFVFSKRDNIKSYLFGDDNFLIPHWFISKKLNDFNQERIDKTLKIFNVSSLSQAKKIIKSRIKKTPCIFCSEKTLRKVNKFYRGTFPEITWCNDRVK